MVNEAQKITLLGGIVNSFLAIFKIIFGTLGNSTAIVADGIHSLSDLVSDILVFWVAKHSHKAPDVQHPYGHKKFETLTTLALGVILIIVGLGIIYDAIISINEPINQNYSALLLIVTIVSIISKEIMYWLTLRVGKRINSNMIIANAWHHRLDALSSVIVLIGFIGALNNYPALDKIAAIIVSCFIIRIAWKLIADSSSELVETAITEEEMNALRKVISGVNGVVSVHELQTRKIGGDILADIHIQVEPYLTVSEGHIISVNVEKTVTIHLDNVHQVVIHIDPENDEIVSPYDDFPDRTETLNIIHKILSSSEYEYTKNIHDIKLHYLNGKIKIDFYLALSYISDKKYTSEHIHATLSKLLANSSYFGTIRVFFV